MSNVVSIHDHQLRLWQDYLDAKDKADQSRSMEDGIAAGKAYSRWLELFVREDQRHILRGKVSA